MKRRYTIGIVALIGSAIAGASVAQVGGIGQGTASRGGMESATAPATPFSTALSGTSRLPSHTTLPAQGSAAVVIPDAVTPSTEISTEQLPGSPAPASILITKETPVSVTTRARYVVRGANPACTGVSGDADVCKGWE